MQQHPADEIVFGKTGYSSREALIYRKDEKLSYRLTRMENRMIYFLSARPNAFLDFKEWITYSYFPYPYSEPSFRVLLCKLRRKLVDLGGFDIHLFKNDLVQLHTYEEGGMGSLDIVNSIGAEDTIYFQNIGINPRWQAIFDKEKGLCTFLTTSEIQLFMYCMDRFDEPLVRTEVAQAIFENETKLNNLATMMSKLNVKLYNFGYILRGAEKFHLCLSHTHKNYNPYGHEKAFA